MLALQEELSDSKERNIQLTARCQQRERDLNEAREQVEALAKNKEELRKKVQDLEVRKKMRQNDLHHVSFVYSTNNQLSILGNVEAFASFESCHKMFQFKRWSSRMRL